MCRRLRPSKRHSGYGAIPSIMVAASLLTFAMRYERESRASQRASRSSYRFRPRHGVRAAAGISPPAVEGFRHVLEPRRGHARAGRDQALAGGSVPGEPWPGASSAADSAVEPVAKVGHLRVGPALASGNCWHDFLLAILQVADPVFGPRCRLGGLGSGELSSALRRAVLRGSPVPAAALLPDGCGVSS